MLIQAASAGQGLAAVRDRLCKRRSRESRTYRRLRSSELARMQSLPRKATELRATKVHSVDDEGNELPAPLRRHISSASLQASGRNPTENGSAVCRQRHDTSQRVEIERAPSWHGCCFGLTDFAKMAISIFACNSCASSSITTHDGERPMIRTLAMAVFLLTTCVSSFTTTPSEFRDEARISPSRDWKPSAGSGISFKSKSSPSLNIEDQFVCFYPFYCVRLP